jgi:hypothetical protein
MRLILAIAAFVATALAAPQYGSIPTNPFPSTSSPIDVTLTNSKGKPVGTIGFGSGQDIGTTVIVSGDGSNTINNGPGNPDPNVIVVGGNGIDSTTVIIN